MRPHWRIRQQPLADGGEGTAEVLLGAGQVRLGRHTCRQRGIRHAVAAEPLTEALAHAAQRLGDATARLAVRLENRS